MDALGELVAGALELVMDFLPLRVSTVIVANVAVMYFAAGWVTEHQAAPAADWVAGGAWIVLPFASLALLLWRRRGRERAAVGVERGSVLERHFAALRASPDTKAGRQR